jgi:hypothetical protein
MTNPIRHRDPKPTPFCACCGAWIRDYPFAGTDRCGKCEEKS